MHWTTPPRKHLGQHFLQDDQVIAAILKAAAFQPGDQVIEIGPGRGALTLPLLKQLDHLTVIEVDRTLAQYWRHAAPPTLTVCEADALTVNYQQWGKGLRVIGNLPYNISTPLLLHLLMQRTSVQDMIFMLQKEVAHRLIAQPHTKAYGRLTVMLQSCFTIQALFDVSPEAFDPPPQVMSSVVVMQPHDEFMLTAEILNFLEQLLHQAFSMRRKMIGKTLKPLCDAACLASFDINVQARPEDLSVGEYVRLAKGLLALKERDHV